MSSNVSNHMRLLSLTKQLTSYVNQGRHLDALSLFHTMQNSPSLTLDPFVFSLVLKSCTATHRLQLGSSIHAHATKCSLLYNPFIASALVDMYGKCFSISSARKLFDQIPQRNVVSWNSMISLYARSGHMDAALDLFQNMDVAPNDATFNALISSLSELEDGFSKAIGFYRRMQQLRLRPNLITLLALLHVCVGVAALSLIQEIHGYAFRSDIEPHPQLRTGFIEAYGRCGSLINARNVFLSMKERDVVAWSSLISAYALHGEAKAALQVFQQMELAKVWPDDITFLAVLKACSHAGLADEALHYFDKMHEDYKVEATADHYSCLVDTLSRAGKLYEAYKVIKAMPMKPTAKTWGALLAACRTYGEVELAETAARALLEIDPSNAANYVLLARIYASVGRYEEAQRMRMEMKERRVKVAPGSSWVVNQE